MGDLQRHMQRHRTLATPYQVVPNSTSPIRPKEATGRGKSKVEIGNPVGARNVRADGETKYVHYKVHIKDGGLLDEEVYIYDFVPAKFDICTNSMLYATVVSPLSHLIVDYKNLRQAQIRRSHADAWNTQSHLITTFKPGTFGGTACEQHVGDQL